MSNRDFLIQVLQQTEDAVRKIIKRFENVESVGYFTDTAEGIEKLDAICMLLIAVGESLKNIDKITDKNLFSRYPDIDWKGAKGCATSFLIIILILMQRKFTGFVSTTCNRWLIQSVK